MIEQLESQLRKAEKEFQSADNIALKWELASRISNLKLLIHDQRQHQIMQEYDRKLNELQSKKHDIMP